MCERLGKQLLPKSRKTYSLSRITDKKLMRLYMDEKVYWHGLNMVPGLGTLTYNRLIDHFKTAKCVWEAGATELQAFFGKKNNIIAQLLIWRKQYNLEEAYNQLKKLDISILTSIEEDYPFNLRNIYAYPPVLYYRGSIKSIAKQSLAIVGSRKSTSNGQQVAEKIAFELAQAGFVIVSGMARGIDSYAHRGAIRSGGETVAVLGCGLDIIYPPENKKLMDLISSNGVVISEFPPGIKPEAKNFPRRNRLISGLSKGVIVVEAAEKSGSLITADLALQQGRDVFAVPGSILSPYSKGTNYLIKQGAKLVQDANDILEEYGLPVKKEVTKKIAHLNPVEKTILNLFSSGEISLEEIIKKSRIKPEIVISQLSILEIKGIIKQLPGQRYINIL